jgi:hypothetical protein
MRIWISLTSFIDFICLFKSIWAKCVFHSNIIHFNQFWELLLIFILFLIDIDSNHDVSYFAHKSLIWVTHKTNLKPCRNCLMLFCWLITICEVSNLTFAHFNSFFFLSLIASLVDIYLPIGTPRKLNWSIRIFTCRILINHRAKALGCAHVLMLVLVLVNQHEWRIM